MTDHSRDQRRRDLFRQLLAQQGIDLTAEAQEETPSSDPAPLSSAQQRVFFQQQLDPQSTVYNLSAGVRITGNVNIPALQDAITTLTQQFGILHTVYAADGSTQHERPELTATLRHESANSEDEALSYARNMAREPFDLCNEIPIRFLLITRKPDEYILVVVIHHIAADDASWAILFPNLFTLYHRFASGERPTIAQTIHYGDYARWEAQALSEDRRSDMITHWRSVLEPHPQRVALPLDHARPPAGAADHDEEGGVSTHLIPAALREELISLCRSESATQFMGELALFAVLLHRHTGQHDMTIGIPALLRDRWQTHQQVGNFQNTLVIRLDIDPSMSFRSVLQQTRVQCQNAYMNQDLPFDQLVAELQPPRQAGRTPWIDVMFLEQKPMMAGVSCPGLTLEEITLHNGTSQFDLTVAVCNLVDGIELTALHRTAVLNSATVSSWLDRYHRLMTSAVADPDMAVDTLPIAPPIPRTPAPVLPTPVSLSQRLRDSIERHSQHIAIAAKDTNISYCELGQRSAAIARALASHGAGPGANVAVLVADDPESLIAIAGVTLSGAAYVPIDASTPPTRIAELLNMTAPVAVCSPHTDVRKFWSGPIISHEPTEASPQDSDGLASMPDPDNSPDDPAYIIFTSGSTGVPKGVVVRSRNVTRLFDITHPTFNFSSDDRWLLAHSLAFDFSVWEMWGALLYGGTLVVADNRRDIDLVARQIARDRITFLNQTPTAFSVLAPHLSTGDIQDLRWIVFGGEKLDPWRLREWLTSHSVSPALMNMYGITETTVHTTWRRITIDDTVNESQGSPIGTPLPDVTCDVVDTAGNPVPPGVVGEIIVGGAGVAIGYLDDPDRTAERFINNETGRYYLTGDLARRRPNGELEFLGRKDSQLQIRGFRIEPGEVEAAIASHPNISETAVGSDGERLVSWIVTQQSNPIPTVKELTRWCGARLPQHMIPDRWFVIDHLPMTMTNKLDRDALLRLTSTPLRTAAPTETSAPSLNDSTSKVVLSLWQKLLGIDNIGLHENFFDLGGHSLLLAQLRDEIAEHLAVRLPIADLYAYPTLSAQIQRLSTPQDNAEAHTASHNRAAQQRAALLRQQRVRGGHS